MRLKREMNSISAQDDFARWAKLRRQHDKAEDEYKRKSTLHLHTDPLLVSLSGPSWQSSSFEGAVHLDPQHHTIHCRQHRQALHTVDILERSAVLAAERLGALACRMAVVVSPSANGRSVCPGLADGMRCYAVSGGRSNWSPDRPLLQCASELEYKSEGQDLGQCQRARATKITIESIALSNVLYA
jgi:hypothetical protein